MLVASASAAAITTARRSSSPKRSARRGVPRLPRPSHGGVHRSPVTARPCTTRDTAVHRSRALHQAPATTVRAAEPALEFRMTPEKDGGPAPRPDRRGDEAALRAQLLATEHWSLLATRSMTWSEIFSRTGTFLT